MVHLGVLLLSTIIASAASSAIDDGRVDATPQISSCYTCEKAISAVCPDTDWYLRGDYCYKLFNFKLAWEQAVNMCETSPIGSTLAILRSSAEQSLVEGIVKEDKKITENYWIGLRRKDEEWFWNNGSTVSKLSYENWNRNSVNFNHKNADCVFMENTVEHQWSNSVCETKNYFICQTTPSTSYKADTNAFSSSKAEISVNGKTLASSNSNLFTFQSIKGDNIVRVKFDSPMTIYDITVSRNCSSCVQNLRKISNFEFVTWTDNILSYSGTTTVTHQSSTMKMLQNSTSSALSKVKDVRTMIFQVHLEDANQVMQVSLSSFSQWGTLESDCTTSTRCVSNAQFCYSKVVMDTFGRWQVLKGCDDDSMCSRNSDLISCSTTSNTSECGLCCTTNDCNVAPRWSDFTKLMKARMLVYGSTNSFVIELLNKNSTEYSTVQQMANQLKGAMLDGQCENIKLVNVTRNANSSSTAVFIFEMEFRFAKVAKKLDFFSQMEGRVYLKLRSNDFGRMAFANFIKIDDKFVCPTNVTLDPLKGVFHWLETQPMAEARIVCSQNATQFATRSCDIDANWLEPNLDACEAFPSNRSLVDSLIKTIIMPENVQFVTSVLNSYTSSAANFDAGEISQSMNVLENVLEFYKITGKKSIVSSKIFDSLNNMLRVNREALKQSQNEFNSADRFLSLVDEFTNLLPLNQQGLCYDRMANVRVSKSSTADQQLTPLEIKGSTKMLEALKPVDTPSSGGNVLANIAVPNDVLDGMRAESIACNVYLDDKYFIQKDDRRIIASVVVGLRLLGANQTLIETNNLEKAIQLQFQLQAPFNTTPQVVFWNKMNKTWSTVGSKIVAWNETSGIVRANFTHLTDFAVLFDVGGSTKYSEVARWASILGCSISLVGLVITIATYGLISKVRKDDPGKMILFLAISLACANIIFLCGSWYGEDDSICKVIAALLHYFFLSSFAWTVPFSYRMIRQLKSFKRGAGSIFKRSALFAFGVPLLIVGITLSLIAKFPDIYHHNSNMCWLATFPFYFAFLMPVSAVLLFNFLTISYVIYVSCQVAHQNTEKIGKIVRPEEQKKQMRRATVTSIGLTFLMGLTWTFGILTIVQNSVFVEIVQILFSIFNSLQGFFIFLFFCLLKTDVNRVIRHRLAFCSDPKSSTATYSNKNSSNSGGFRSKNQNKPPSPSEQDTASTYAVDSSTTLPRKKESATKEEKVTELNTNVVAMTMWSPAQARSNSYEDPNFILSTSVNQSTNEQSSVRSTSSSCNSGHVLLYTSFHHADPKTSALYVNHSISTSAFVLENNETL